MSRFGIARGVLAGAVLLVGVLVAAPVGAEPTAYTGWTQREDGSAPGSGRTYAVSGPDADLQMVSFDTQVAISSDADGTALGANFVPPAGQTLQAGHTYLADVSQDEPTPTVGRLMVWRDRTMCGKTEEELFAGYLPPAPATGWFHVSDLERDADGNVTRFAATYEINCQYVGGPAGFEGSVAVNSTLPAAPVPAVPAAPGAVTDVKVTNTGPSGSGQNSTTLTWTNPVGFGDVEVDRVQSSDRSKLPAILGAYDVEQYRGRADQYHESGIDFMDTRTYRVVARGAHGRLGRPAFVTVLGTRLSIPEPTQTITIGQRMDVSGRLSEAWDYVNPADVMKGPGLVGRTVVLCRQSSTDYVDGECTPVDRTTTTADGRFTLSATPRENSYYSVLVPATSGMLGNISRVLTTGVAPQTDLRAPESQVVRTRTTVRPGPTRRVSVRRGSVIHFTTSRARAGARGVIRLQRLDGHRWRTIATRRLGRGSAARRLALPYREHARGRHAYRVVKPGDPHHVNGYSRIVHIRVR